MTVTELPEVCRTAEVASVLRTNDAKVRDLIASGALYGFRVGRCWRVPRWAVERLLGLEPARDGSDDVEAPSGAGGLELGNSNGGSAERGLP